MRALLFLAALLGLPATAQVVDADRLPLMALPQAAPEPERRGDVEADVQATWEGEPQWLVGYSFGLETFNSGLGRGRNAIFESSIGPEDDVPVRIEFGAEASLAGRMPFGTFTVDAVGTFPGAVYDVSDPESPRRLNVVFSEQEPLDGAWNPTNEASGNREWLLVMDSDYDATGETYLGQSPFGTPLDIQYFLWPRVPDGQTLLASEAALVVELFQIRAFEATVVENGQIALSWTYDAPDEVAALEVRRGADEPETLLATLPPDADAFETTGSGRQRYQIVAVDAAGDAVDRSRAIEVSADVALNASLLGRLDPNNGGGGYGDVWGYTDPATGRDYALLTERAVGLHVIDVTDDAPVLVATVDGLPNTIGGDGAVGDAKDVKTYGRYAYLAHEFASVLVIDLQNPAAPVVAGTLDTQPGATGGGAHNLEVAGDVLYALGGRDPGGLRAYDLAADPTSPPLVGEYQPSYFHDLHVRGDRAYASGIYDEGVYVIDVSDPSDPALLTLFSYAAGYVGAHNACSTEDAAFLYVGDEIGTGPWTRAFDVRDLDDVVQTGELIVNENAVTHNCYVSGDFLFIAHYTEGLQVFDVGTNPSQPERVAFYDTFAPSATGFDGAWSVYPYFASGKVIVSDISSGLFVIGVDGYEGAPVQTAPGAAAPLPLALAVSPNPSVGRATLTYSAPAGDPFTLDVFDALGRRVASLSGEAAAASGRVGLDVSGWAPGVYFARLQAGAAQQVVQLTVAR